MTPPGRGSLVSDSAVYLGSNLLNGLIPFALLPVLTRYLDQAQYGEVAMFQSVFVALGAVLGLSLQGAAARKYYDLTEAPREMALYIGACLQLLAASSVIVLIAVTPFAGRIASWLGIRVEWIPWAVVACACSFVVLIRMGQWQARRMPRHYAAMQVSQSAINMGLSLLLVVVFSRGAQGRVEAMIVVPMGMAIVALVLLRRDGQLSFGWRPDFAREAAHFGVPLVPHAVGVFLLATTDRFVVNAHLGLAQTGVYMVAVQMALGLALVFDSVNSSYVPWLFERLKRDQAHEKQQIVRYTYLYFLGAAAVAGLAFLLGPWFVTLVAGESYAAAGPALGWLALGQSFTGMYLMVTNYVFFSKRTGLLSAVTVVSGLIGLLLLMYLTERSGLIGAAQAFAATMFIRFLMTWYVAHRRHPMPWGAPWGSPLAAGTLNAP